MYFRTDEEIEVVDAMRMATQFAEGVANEMHLWRWLIISMHSAAQGCMVLSLRHGNGLLALSDRSYAEWIAAYEKGESPPPERLDNYLNLYKKVRDQRLGTIGGSARFVPQGGENADIKHLNKLRNEFVHFTPKSWSLEVDGLPRICLATAKLVAFLAFETKNIFWHRAEARQSLQDEHRKVVASLQGLQARYAKQAER